MITASCSPSITASSPLGFQDTFQLLLVNDTLVFMLVMGSVRYKLGEAHSDPTTGHVMVRVIPPRVCGAEIVIPHAAAPSYSRISPPRTSRRRTSRARAGVDVRSGSLTIGAP